MATRLYMATAGTPASTPTVDPAWERNHATFYRAPTSTSKSDSALTTKSGVFGATNTSQTCWAQFVSEPLDVDQTIAGTIRLIVGKCGETSNGGDAHLAFSLRVMVGDTSTVRGTLLLVHSTGAEFPLVASAATRIKGPLTLTSVAALAGDRIVMEVGVHGVTPANEVMQLRFGDPTAVADFAFNSGQTLDEVPWFELSQNITFGAPAPDPTRGRISWAELEAPLTPTRGRVAWTEFETPAAPADPTRGRLSWAEFETPLVGTRGRISWSELEAPIALTRGRISWAELEAPTALTRGRAAWAEFEVPAIATRGRVAWAEFEAPSLGGGGYTSGRLRRRRS